MSSQVVFIGISFVVVLGLFIFALFKLVINKPAKRTFDFNDEDAFSIETVMLVLDSKTSTILDLQDVIDKLFDNYDLIAPTKQQSINILLALSLHKQADKDIILNTEKLFAERTPEHKNIFERAVKKGLDGRGMRWR